jgi:uncharacterized protein involved in exopolysaccharide biosynthesis
VAKAAAPQTTPPIQKYNGQLAELEATKIGYQDKYTPKHPKMVEINDQIASLKAQNQSRNQQSS